MNSGLLVGLVCVVGEVCVCIEWPAKCWFSVLTPLSAIVLAPLLAWCVWLWKDGTLFNKAWCCACARACVCVLSRVAASLACVLAQYTRQHREERLLIF